MRNYMIFITGLAPQPKQEKRVLLNASRVTNPGNSYTDGKGNDVDFPGFKISIPSNSGTKLSYVNIKESWIRSENPVSARTIYWSMVAFNLNGLAALWFDACPELAYKGSSQSRPAQGELTGAGQQLPRDNDRLDLPAVGVRADREAHLRVQVIARRL